MASTDEISRREALKRSLMLPLAAGMALPAAAAGATAAAEPGRVLVAFFTRTGNTRVIAGQIARAQAGTLFQIVPAAPYPEDYEAQVAQAEDERRRGYEPALQADVPDFARYETVYLGLPVWGTTAPAIIRSFLSRHDMSGKTLAPFVTHGGYGLGSSIAVIARHAPRARMLDPFSMECDQERRTLRQVSEWLART